MSVKRVTAQQLPQMASKATHPLSRAAIAFIMNAEVATGDTAAAAAIQGLTHPNRFLVACNHLWKRRGALTSAIKQEPPQQS